MKSIVDLSDFVYRNNLLHIKKYLPYFRDVIRLHDHKITINYKNNKLDIKGRGEVSVEDKIDSLIYELSQDNNNYDFKTTIELINNSLLLNFLNYKKDANLYSTLNVDGSYKKNKKVIFNSISLIDKNDNNLRAENLILNNEFKIKNIDLIDLNFTNNSNIKNKIILKKNKNKYEVYGNSFDATHFINKLLNADDTEKSSIFSNLNTSMNIKINKTYIDESTYLNNVNASVIFKNNNIDKLNLEAFFPNDKKLTFSVNTNKENEKITTLFSDYPKPLVGRYKFIKGFEEGVLDFYSKKKNNISNSVLKINNFKLQEVPALAKLLTLASLQGIADLITGEGIRFSDFEMHFQNSKQLMTINEIYAFGPSISILMDGYIEPGRLISLRGTLVPASTINRAIATIPLVGNILVGKKVGEGVFGVSFKIKGKPNNLKTIVNPVKSLTPRFITRTLEKMKKN